MTPASAAVRRWISSLRVAGQEVSLLVVLDEHLVAGVGETTAVTPLPQPNSTIDEPAASDSMTLAAAPSAICE